LIGSPALQSVDLSNSKFMIYGAALVAMMLLRPEGLFPSRQRQVELHEGGGSTAAAEAVEVAEATT
jgi:branched-chain amino acid transport system permease protein